jgi:uncharacterized protein (DUF58 family)
MIPAPMMRELRYLEIFTAKAIRTARIGPYTSRARGAGFDFDQHLPYRPGDDVRRIDWNATARLNTPYVRQTHAERELDLVMAVDLSRSMEIGSGRYSKKELMTLITASLLFSASADQINAGFLAFSDRVLRWTPPRRASGHAWRVLEDIWSLEPEQSRTSVLPAIRHMMSRLRTMSIVPIISDFLTDEDVFASAHLRLFAAQHDVIAVVVEDPSDTSVPSGRGFMRVRDVETGARLTVALNERTRRTYAAAVARRRQMIRDACYSLGIDFVFVRTDAPVLEPLIELFARRKSV